VQLFFVACRPNAANQEQVRGPFRWVRRDELRGREFPPANATILDLLLGS
jgi:hypothetical protein